MSSRRYSSDRRAAGALETRRRILTAAEQELRAAGYHAMTVAGLARRFSHSEREMYRLLSATYQRLGVQSRTEALLAAQRHGLFDQPA